MQINKNQKNWITVLGICGALAILGWLFTPRGTRKPDDVAKNVLECFNDSNIGCLLDFQHEHEKKQIQLSPAEWKSIVEWTKGTLLAGCTIEPQIRTERYGEHGGIAMLRVKKGSKSVDIELTSEATPTGPKVCLTTLISSAFYARTELDGRSSSALDWREYRGAYADTLDQYKSDLERLRFPGFVSNFPKAKVHSVSGTIQLYRRIRADKSWNPPGKPISEMD